MEKDSREKVIALTKRYKQLLSERQELVDMRDAERIRRTAELWDIPAGEDNPLLKSFIEGRIKAAVESVKAIVRLNYIKENSLSNEMFQ